MELQVGMTLDMVQEVPGFEDATWSDVRKVLKDSEMYVGSVTVEHPEMPEYSRKETQIKHISEKAAAGGGGGSKVKTLSDEDKQKLDGVGAGLIGQDFDVIAVDLLGRDPGDCKLGVPFENYLKAHGMRKGFRTEGNKDVYMVKPAK